MRNYSFVTTMSGGYLSLEQPSPDNINKEDIARGLTNVCRFSGQLPQHYSVAAHSLALAEMYTDPDVRLYCLLHDASEAYITDLPAPVKELCPAYVELEESVMSAVFASFGVPEVYMLSDYTPIKMWDRTMASLEQYVLQGENCPEWALEALYENLGKDFVSICEPVLKYIGVLADKEPEDIEALYLASLEEALDDYRKAYTRQVQV